MKFQKNEAQVTSETHQIQFCFYEPRCEAHLLKLLRNRGCPPLEQDWGVGVSRFGIDELMEIMAFYPSIFCLSGLFLTKTFAAS